MQFAYNMLDLGWEFTPCSKSFAHGGSARRRFVLTMSDWTILTGPGRTIPSPSGF